MAAGLDVYRNHLLIGHIEFKDVERSNDFVFTYDPDYRQRTDAYGLGMNFPVADEAIEAKKLLDYFDGLLPEGDNRVELARLLKSDEGNVGDLLSKLAGDCIGDLMFLDSAFQGDSANLERYEPLSVERFSELTKPSSPSRNLVIAEKRFSLTGAQQKIGLFKNNTSEVDAKEGWLLPNAFAHSNFILKPSSSAFPDSAVNEYLCMKLAGSCEIDVPDIWLIDPLDPVFIIRRFDRAEHEGMTLRLQQEDLCQLLDKEKTQRYENASGPSVNDVIGAISWYSGNTYGDKLQFMRLFIFNFLIGNTDAHGKNFSFTRESNGTVILSPAYDILSVSKYTGAFRDMAMRIGREYLLDNTTQEDWEIFAQQCNARFSLIREIYKDTSNNILADIESLTDSLMDKGFTAAAPLREHVVKEVNAKKDLLG
jgi:serine/threonine-protein kinase HipA